ncbi:hypothetical protein ACJW30_04G007800 [Castanea mollissima]
MISTSSRTNTLPKEDDFGFEAHMTTYRNAIDVELNMFYSTCLSVLDSKVNLVPMLLEILEEFQIINNYHVSLQIKTLATKMGITAQTHITDVYFYGSKHWKD